MGSQGEKVSIWLWQNQNDLQMDSPNKIGVYPENSLQILKAKRKSMWGVHILDLGMGLNMG